MSDEARITLAIVCAALGAIIGMGVGYAVEPYATNPGFAFGLRLVLAGSLALFMLCKTIKDTDARIRNR